MFSVHVSVSGEGLSLTATESVESESLIDAAEILDDATDRIVAALIKDAPNGIR